MNTIHDAAILILRYMLEKGIIAEHSVSYGELLKLTGLEPDEFDKGDSFLFQAKLVEGTGGGVNGSRWLTAYGVQYIDQEMKRRTPISLDAERVLRFLIQEMKDEDFPSMQKVIEGVNISRAQYWQVCYELADFDFVKITGDEYDPEPIPTKKGRLAVRRNFQESLSGASIQAGAIFNGPVTGANIQAIANAIGSGIQQNVSALTQEELHKEVEQVLEELVSQVSDLLTLQQKAEYTKLAVKLQEEIEKPKPEPDALHKMLAGLGFLSDLSGTIDFGQKTFELIVKAGPFISLLGHLLLRLLQNAAQ
jgi:hypothetical protein